MKAMGVEPGEQFSAVFEQFYGRVHAYAARRVGRDAADEIAAETFAIAWRRREAIPPEPLPWLYGVAHNVVLRWRSECARQHNARVALEHEPRLRPRFPSIQPLAPGRGEPGRCR